MIFLFNWVIFRFQMLILRGSAVGSGNSSAEPIPPGPRQALTKTSIQQDSQCHKFSTAILRRLDATWRPVPHLLKGTRPWIIWFKTEHGEENPESKQALTSQNASKCIVSIRLTWLKLGSLRSGPRGLWVKQLHETHSVTWSCPKLMAMATLCCGSHEITAHSAHSHQIGGVWK